MNPLSLLKECLWNRARSSKTELRCKGERAETKTHNIALKVFLEQSKYSFARPDLQMDELLKDMDVANRSRQRQRELCFQRWGYWSKILFILSCLWHFCVLFLFTQLHSRTKKLCFLLVKFVSKSAIIQAGLHYRVSWLSQDKRVVIVILYHALYRLFSILCLSSAWASVDED